MVIVCEAVSYKDIVPRLMKEITKGAKKLFVYFLLVYLWVVGGLGPYFPEVELLPRR